MKSRFIYIVIAIVLVILVSPFLRQAGALGWLTSSLLVAMIPLASYYALYRDKKRAMIIIFLGAPFVLLDAVSHYYVNRYLPTIMYGFGTALYLYITILMLENLLARKKITTDMIFCAISIYLLLGVMWAGVFAVLESVSPGSLSGIPGSIDYVYFSFVTLTSVGYGDISPLTTLSQRFAIIEAAMGSIYMAIIVALIVGRYISSQRNSD